MTEFDQTLKERAAREDCPTPVDFDGRVDTILSELPEKRRTGRRRGPVRVLLSAAALCVLCVVSALALSPGLRDTLAQMLGGFEPYSQTVEGVAVVDQGIEVRVVSALVDDSGGAIYLAVTDLTGDRLEAGIGLDNYTAISYDTETGSALFKINIETAVQVNSDGTLQGLQDTYPLRFQVVYPAARIAFEEISIPWEQAGEDILESYTLEDGNIDPKVDDRTVLEPGQTPMALEGTELFSISSMGWDDKGTFHILLEMADGVFGSEFGINFTVEGKMWDSTDYYTSLKDRNYGRSQKFIIDNGRYVDLAFQEAAEYDLKNILSETFTLQGYVYQSQPIYGEWDLEAPLELLPARTVSVQDTLGRENMLLESLTFSVIGVQAHGSTWENSRATLVSMPLTVYLADGTTVRAVPDISRWTGVAEGAENGATGQFQSVWTFEEPVDPQTIVGVALAQRYIPIDGDAAGEGSWLAEIP